MALPIYNPHARANRGVSEWYHDLARLFGRGAAAYITNRGITSSRDWDRSDPTDWRTHNRRASFVPSSGVKRKRAFTGSNPFAPVHRYRRSNRRFVYYFRRRPYYRRSSRFSRGYRRNNRYNYSRSRYRSRYFLPRTGLRYRQRRTRWFAGKRRFPSRWY